MRADITWLGQQRIAEVRFLTSEEVTAAAYEWRDLWNALAGLVPSDQTIDSQWNWIALAALPSRCAGVFFGGCCIGMMIVGVALESHSDGTALVCERIAKRPDLRLPDHANTFGIGEAMIDFLRMQSESEGHAGRMLVRDAVPRAQNFYLSGGFSVVSYDRQADTYWMEAP